MRASGSDPSSILELSVTGASSLPAAAEAVLTFLETVGKRSEAELYLKLFRTLPKHQFALVAADYLVVRHSPGSLAEGLEFLSQMGLVAPIVLGLFNPETALRGAQTLTEILHQRQLRPRIHSMDEEELAQNLREELSVDQVPVLKFSIKRGEHPRDRFAQLGRLAGQLGTRKVVVLRQRGSVAIREEARVPDGAVHESRTPVVGAPGVGPLGLEMSGEGGQLSVLNLRSDFDALLAHDLLRQDDARLIEFVQGLLVEAHNPRLTLSITSPLTLLRELFTLKGDGTLVKLGAEIRRTESYQDLEVPRLAALLERSFNRKLKSGLFERPPLSVFLETQYRGAAIVEPTPIAPYLTKFAVEPLAQGEGVGRDLWQALTRDHSRLVWRARPRNPISAWYATQCDGLVRLPRWTVFWRGLETSAIPSAVQNALERPEDFD